MKGRNELATIQYSSTKEKSDYNRDLYTPFSDGAYFAVRGATGRFGLSSGPTVILKNTTKYTVCVCHFTFVTKLVSCQVCFCFSSNYMYFSTNYKTVFGFFCTCH